MQPPPLPAIQSVSYKVSRDILLRIWCRRHLFRPENIRNQAIMLFCAISFFVIRHGAEYFAFSLLLFMVILPVALYRGLAKVIDGNPQFTDEKTLEFSPSNLIISGQNWRSEMPWTKFTGFSEDAEFFLLHLPNSPIASIIPKSAFTSEQQLKFREYARCQLPDKQKA